MSFSWRWIFLIGLGVPASLLLVSLPWIVIWLRADEPARTLHSPVGTITSMAFSADGTRLACSSWRGVIVYDVATGELLGNLQRHGIKSVASSPSGKMLALGSQDGWVSLWNTETGLETVVFNDQIRSLTGFVAISPDGTLLATGGFHQSYNVELWDVATRQLKLTFVGHNTLVNSIAFSSAGTRMATTTPDEVKVWDLKARTSILTIDAGYAWINTMAFSPDGKTVAVGGYKGTVKLWTVPGGQELATARPSWFGVSALAYSPDGTTLAEARPSKIRLWNASGELRATIRPPERDPTSLGFSPDGKMLAAGIGGTVMLWNVADELEAAH
jgi:WD40 repeat protein